MYFAILCIYSHYRVKKRHKKYQEQGSTRDIERCVAKINFGKFERCCLERHRTGEVAGKGIK